MFPYLVKMVACSAILFGYYYCFLRNERFHQYNRFFLLGIVLLSFCLPLLKLPLLTPGSMDAVLQTWQRLSPAPVTLDEVVVSSNTRTVFHPQNGLTWCYAGVSLLLSIRLFMACRNVLKLKKGQPGKRIGRIRLFWSDHPKTPFSFFNWMFWNPRLSMHSPQGKQIFRHEWYHIRQKHSWDLFFIELVCVCCWLNPFFFLIRKELHTLHEFLADRHVTRSTDRFDYAQLLVRHSLGAAHHPLMTPFFNTDLKRRIAMLTQNRQPVLQYLRKAMALPVIATALFLVSFAPVKKALLAVSFALPGPEIHAEAFSGMPANTGGLQTTSREELRQLGPARQPISMAVPISNGVSAATIPSIELPPAEQPVVVFPTADTLPRYQERGPEIFTKVERDASFPGGPDAWKQFLQANLRFPEKNNAPAGTYTAIVQFIVDREGAISDIKVIADPGYNFGAEAKRVIQLSGKWNPALQNKRVVKAYRKQPITFNVS
ncbi:M56 family metallopeptidase [Niabella pedocola]|uniref:M56 family metallopeptidase n=1 Tax=Niabella pedocola TaxID=1752077 RepID=A0ABS8PM66_9BACT|nr:M56 family metallopeptidase [Niabella pedocola]MCD2421960.1 M56 family metallopeptidase [Niabella pedocola]